jgi:hypothetical protein
MIGSWVGIAGTVSRRTVPVVLFGGSLNTRAADGISHQSDLSDAAPQRGIRFGITIRQMPPSEGSSSPCGCDTSTSIALPRTACRPAAPRDQAPGHTPLAAGEPARSPLMGWPAPSSCLNLRLYQWRNRYDSQ